MQLGSPGRGVPGIASILNITRIYACIGVVCNLRRSLAIAKDFASKREAFGRTLDKTPLHITTLAQLELVFRAGLQIAFYCVELLGRVECQKATKEDAQMLRFLTPIAKGYVCKVGVQAISEAMEALGGQGYMEDTGMGRLLRDAQVNTIWEGTTNVMAMDVLRVMQETKFACLNVFKKVCATINAFTGCKLTIYVLQTVEDKLDKVVQASERLRQPVQTIRTALKNIQNFVQKDQSRSYLEINSRQLMFALGRVLAGSLLLEQAAFGLSNQLEDAEEDVLAAQHWCSQHELVQDIASKSTQWVHEEAKIVFGKQAKI